MRILKNAFDNYKEEHLALVESSVQPQDLEAQNDALAQTQEMYLNTYVKLEERIDIIEAEAEERVLQANRLEREEEERQRRAEDEGNEPNRAENNDQNRNNGQQNRAQNMNNGADDNSADNRNNNENVRAAGNGVTGRPMRMERDEYLLDHFKPPQFDGSYGKWTEWKSAYESMIHISSLNDTRKMYLLKQCLIGSAERVLSGWQIVGNHYAAAYDTLCAVYQNSYRITMSHLDELFGMLKLQRESYDGLRWMIDTTNSVTRQLRAQGSPVDHWNHVIVHVLINRMPPRTLMAWEEKDDHNGMPTQEEVLKFLSQRARSQLNYEQPLHMNYEGQNRAENLNRQMPDRAGTSNQNKFTGTKPKQQFVQQKKDEQKTGVSCNMCKQPHPMYRCASFQILNLKERWNKVRELNLCANCFSTNHRAGSLSCRSGPCKRCNKGSNHNTLLCHIQIASSNAITTNNWQQPSPSAQGQLNAVQQNQLTLYQPPGTSTQNKASSTSA